MASQKVKTAVNLGATITKNPKGNENKDPKADDNCKYFAIVGLKVTPFIDHKNGLQKDHCQEQ